MSTSSDNVFFAGRSETSTLAHDRFIDRERPVLLRYLDAIAPGSPEEPDALGYIDSVLKAWHEAFGQTKIADPRPEERTFWFALYLLEELIELPGPDVDPYENVMLENLVEARELLRHCRPLPEHRFMATRPDGS